MVLCDTNVFIHAFNGQQTVIDRLQKIGFEQVALSVITVMELYQGMSNKTELAQMKKKLRYYDFVDIDTETSKLATSLMEKYRLSHHLQIPDAIIGATAVVHQIPFYTFNTKDFDFIPGIQLL
jgi:hypothetical protein